MTVSRLLTAFGRWSTVGRFWLAKWYGYGMSRAALLLDLDGLLIDTERMVLAAFNAAADELGCSLSPTLFHSLIGRTSRDSEVLLRRAFLDDDVSIRSFRTLTQANYERDLAANGIQLMPGADELLTFLEAAGIRFACATSTARKRAWWKLERAGIAHRFHTLVGGDEVDEGKPAPDIFLEAAVRVKAAPERCIVLEDSLNGIRAAAAAGMTAIMVPDLIEPDAEARGIAYAIAADLHEARRIVKTLIG